MLKEFLIKRKLKKMGYPLLEVKQEALDLYRNIVKGNKNETEFHIICKLSRNWYSSTKERQKGNVTWKYYGNLSMGFRDGQIAKIHNKIGDYSLHINDRVYHSINQVINPNNKEVA